MLERSQLIAALLHDDFFVRSRMLDQFTDDSDTDPAITRQYANAIARFGWKDAFEWPARVSLLTFEEKTFAWLVQSILDDSEHRPGSLLLRHLLSAFSKSPVALIERYFAQVSIAHPPKSSALDLASFRIKLAEQSVDECNSLLESLFQECEDGDQFPSPQIVRMEYVSERLAQHGALDSVQIAEHLAIDFNAEIKKAHWQGGHALYQSGLLGLEENVPRILQLYQYDWDWINDDIPKALIAMGTETVLDTLISYHPQRPLEERIDLCRVFEKLRFPSKEHKLLELLDGEEDEEVRKGIAVALVRYATPKALEKALDIYLECPECEEQFEIAEGLYPLLTLSCQQPSLLSKWREQLEAQHSCRSRPSAMEELMLSMVEQNGTLEQRSPSPQSKSGPKVGRNEPCPCGSGKKHKKCCLK